MVAQALLGLRRPDGYRDVEWIAATWWGNDWVTLLVAVPLLAGTHVITQSGSTRATLLYLGMLAYAIYNYTFYLFGAAVGAPEGSLQVVGVTPTMAAARIISMVDDVFHQGVVVRLARKMR